VHIYLIRRTTKPRCSLACPDGRSATIGNGKTQGHAISDHAMTAGKAPTWGVVTWRYCLCGPPTSMAWRAGRRVIADGADVPELGIPISAFLGPVGPNAPCLVSSSLGTAALASSRDSSEAGVDLVQVPAARPILLIAAFPLGLNDLGLVFTGLESTLHVVDAPAGLLGSVRAPRTARVPVWLPVVLVLNPLIRIQGLTIWGAGIIVLILERKVTAALSTLATGVILGGACRGFPHHLGLPLLPSSVMLNSLAVHSSSVVGALDSALLILLHNLLQNGAPPLLFAFVPIAVGVRDRFSLLVALFGCLPIVAHLVLGAFGWFGRYEIYGATLAWGPSARARRGQRPRLVGL
jgi:hypothetical protein